jgi:hypothetical protein
MLSAAKKAAKAAAAKARKEAGKAGEARRAAKKKEEAAKKDASKKVEKKPKATEKGLRLSKKPETQEGMGLDPITGRDVGSASDVDKGKAGKVTRSPEPGFLQQQRTAGSRAKAQTKADLQKIFQKGSDATPAEKRAAKKKYDRLVAKDKLDTVRATAKSAATRKKNTKASLPELKSVPTKKSTKEKPPIELTGKRAGLINEEVFNKLSPGKQEQAVRNAMARVEGPRKRELRAMLDELEPTKAGETGVRRRRQGQTYGMSGASANTKNIDDGVSKGRGGLDFNKGGKVTKRATGAHDFRMNKGGLLLSSVDNRKKR